MGNRVSRITDGFSGRKKKETGHDPVATSAALTDRQYNTDLFVPQVTSDTAAKQSTPGEPIPKTESEHLAEEFPPDEALEDAATEIQASYKGYKTRKEIKELKEHPQDTEQAETGKADTTQDTSPVSQNVAQVSNKESSNEQEIDIDLNDPDVEAAALKIQSGFRGYKKKKVEVTEEHSDVADTEEKTDVKESLKEQQEAVETPPAAQAEDGVYTKMKSNEMLPNQAEQTAKESQGDEKPDDKAENKEKAVVEEDANSKKEIEKVQNAETVPQTQGETEEVDIDLGDPDVAAAALKIQANFRGNILRKKKKVVETKKRDPEGGAENETANVEEVAEAPVSVPPPE